MSTLGWVLVVSLAGLAVGLHLPRQSGRDVPRSTPTPNMTRSYHTTTGGQIQKRAAIPLSELMNFMRPATPVADDILAKPTDALPPTNILNGGFKLGSTSQISYEGAHGVKP